MSKQFERDFYLQDVLTVAPALLGQHLVRVYPGGEKQMYVISETEAYRGETDMACHASKGKTPRTEVMYEEGGRIYMYLIYGMYWMMNVVTGVKNEPQAVLIRGLRVVSGPGRLTRLIKVDRSFYGEDLVASDRIWVEQSGVSPEIITGPRVGIDNVVEPWKDMPWRFLMI